MSGIKLTYFDFSGGRGEDSRLALFIAGVDFEDHRIKGQDWPTFRGATPFGGLPTLEIEGRDGMLAQSNAVLTYIGREYDLHPTDNWEAARHEAVMMAVEAARDVIVPTLRIKDEAEKKAAREALATGYMQTWCTQVERQLDADGPYAGGATLNVVDLKLFVFMNWFIKGSLDHMPGSIFDDAPRLRRSFDAVKAHEKVVEWYQRAS